MNFIDIAEAARATGKNQTTIRRLIKNALSKPYIRVEKSGFGDKYTIEVNYLFSKYPALSKPLSIANEAQTIQHTQPLQTDFERLLREKDERIKDLKEQLEKKDRVIESLTESIKVLPESSSNRKQANSSWWSKILGKN